MLNALHEYFASHFIIFLVMIIFWQNMNGMAKLLQIVVLPYKNNRKVIKNHVPPNGTLQ